MRLLGLLDVLKLVKQRLALRGAERVCCEVLVRLRRAKPIHCVLSWPDTLLHFAVESLLLGSGESVIAHLWLEVLHLDAVRARSRHVFTLLLRKFDSL